MQVVRDKLDGFFYSGQYDGTGAIMRFKKKDGDLDWYARFENTEAITNLK